MDSDSPISEKDKNLQYASQIEARARAAYASTGKEAIQEFDVIISELLLDRRRAEQHFRRQVVSFRTWLFFFLLLFMSLETACIFGLVIASSLPTNIIAVNHVTLQVLVGATLLQVSAMIIVIIKSVYSDSLNRIIMAEGKQIDDSRTITPRKQPKTTSKRSSGKSVPPTNTEPPSGS